MPKGKALTLLRTATGNLVVEYEVSGQSRRCNLKCAHSQGKLLGQVDDAWVSRELMLAYFADKDVISPKVSWGSPCLSAHKLTRS